MLLADEQQLQLAFVEKGKPIKGYEYAVLVTDLTHELCAIAQLYRDRGDAENAFDELKNQWGWGGFTTHDLKRCQFTAMTVALAYNWWSLFVRLAHPKAEKAKAILMRVSRQLNDWKVTAEQLTSTSVWHRVCAFIMAAVTGLNWFEARRNHALSHCITGP